MIVPPSLTEIYPNLKPKLLCLAWLMDEQERHSKKLLESRNRLRVAPADQLPHIRKEIKHHYEWSEFFNNLVNNMKNGKLRDEMNNVELETHVGVVPDDLSDVRCIWVLSAFGHYTKGVLYLPNDPQKNAIIAEAERYRLSCKELKPKEFTVEKLEEAKKIGKEREKERSRVSPDQWQFKKST